MNILEKIQNKKYFDVKKEVKENLSMKLAQRLFEMKDEVAKSLLQESKEKEEDSCDDEEYEAGSKKDHVKEESDDYKEFVKMMMDKHDFDLGKASDEETKAFFKKIDKQWNSDSEKGKDGKVEK